MSELYRVQLSEERAAQNRTMGPYLVRYPRNSQMLALSLAMLNYRHVKSGIVLSTAAPTNSLEPRRIRRIAGLCLTGVFVLGVCFAGFTRQINSSSAATTAGKARMVDVRMVDVRTDDVRAANEKLSARNKRLEALVEVLRERKASGSAARGHAVTRP